MDGQELRLPRAFFRQMLLRERPAVVGIQATTERVREDIPETDCGFPEKQSRGCPYECAFCRPPISTTRVCRTRPIPQILDEVEMLHRQYGDSYHR